MEFCKVATMNCSYDWWLPLVMTASISPRGYHRAWSAIRGSSCSLPRRTGLALTTSTGRWMGWREIPPRWSPSETPRTAALVRSSRTTPQWARSFTARASRSYGGQNPTDRYELEMAPRFEDLQPIWGRWKITSARLQRIAAVPVTLWTMSYAKCWTSK